MDSMSASSCRARAVAVVVLVLVAGAIVAGGGARSSVPDVVPPVMFHSDRQTVRSLAKHAVAVGTGGAVASFNPDATRAGIEILRRGGNAVDAAVAVEAALGVTDPGVAGVGGGGFMVIYLRKVRRVVAIDGFETAPQAFREDTFIDPATGTAIPASERETSGLAVGVPGTLAAWQKALHSFGTMSLAQVLRPAITLARRGFAVDDTYVGTEDLAARLRAFTSSRALFLTATGAIPPTGTVRRNPQLAATYTAIGRDGPSLFYGGRIGQAIIDAVTHPPLAAPSALPFPVRPGLMTANDLARYRAVERPPTHASYRGYDVYGMAPPSSGGSTVAEALNILEGFDLSGSDRELALHRYLEASRLAFADRDRWIGDPDQVAVPLPGLLSKEFARERRCLIGSTARASPVPPADPNPPYPGCSSTAGSPSQTDEGASTNHSTVVDRFGNVVSYTSSLGDLGGSAIAVPGYGFLLNDHLNEFDPLPLSPTQPDPDLPASGKRPRSSAAPTIVLRNGRPFLAVGSLGGPAIITTVLQILLNRIDFKMSLPRAIATPRASQQNTATSQAEPAFLAANAQLASRFGQRFSPADFDFIGAATGIEVLSRGRVESAAEPVRLGGGDAEVVCPHGRRPRGVPRRVCAGIP